MMSEWTPCEIETPPLEDNGRSDDVLVAFDDGTHAVMFYDYDSIGWFDAYGSEWAGYAAPTHWMPLPDSPVKEIVG